mmetsp:Transcript_1723/g.2665  ORF Transcript_1723/g.2665 Transcript_1723/m.2665 type:complete len:419 (+) Transcript_1723:237-1493(+)|eukprot:CAMPEP_0119014164 /NCGR_PEP_ID=MMETSP1176-20130426/9388_1 /TAXON_ID=265551 /ORGANISM="Synedropsis recta cf, Strain CCMP1620" /LENGTH=418 /DNA_ID=CAMNT_0006967307 /DNA_START=231 /DNA_END=1487 /DNA_ORIENTATION=+
MSNPPTTTTATSTTPSYYYPHELAMDYSSLKDAGPAERPLEFPTPTVRRGFQCTTRALDHRTGKVHRVSRVLIPKQQPSDVAYLIRKKVAKSIYGSIFQSVLLNRRSTHERRENRHDIDETIEWKSTEQIYAVKVSSWHRMRHMRGRHLEDPIKEIAAMQLVGDYHSNVLGAIAVLQDEQYLYTVMPYCSGGDLFGRVMTEENHSVDENTARVWFNQLLSGILHLQRKGVCHRDLSLENLLILDGKLVIIDLGMALRVPYTDPSNIGCVTDVSEGTERRLMVAQGQGGKLMYMAPEVVSRDEVFDGFAIDLWASAVILFVLVVGMAPFKWAHESDKRYAKIAKGGLKDLLAGHHISLSAEACDLLQNMLWHDPRKRLSLAGIMQHNWVTGKRFAVRNIPKHAIAPHQTQTRFRGATHA